MPRFTTYSLISGVSGTVCQCDPNGNHINGCDSQNFELSWDGARKIESLSDKPGFDPVYMIYVTNARGLKSPNLQDLYLQHIDLLCVDLQLVELGPHHVGKQLSSD